VLSSYKIYTRLDNCETVARTNKKCKHETHHEDIMPINAILNINKRTETHNAQRQSLYKHTMYSSSLVSPR